MIGFSCIGIGAVIIKVGNFCRIIEEDKQDGFKKGFDTIMLESIDQMNTCVESVSIITNNFNKIFFIIYDILVGNKFIKKDKDGKIIICTKSKLYTGFKDKIEELNSKVKKYQQELKKIKKNKDKDNNNDDDDISSNDDISNNEEDISDVSSDDLNSEELTCDEKKDSNKKNNDDEFYLESS